MKMLLYEGVRPPVSVKKFLCNEVESAIFDEKLEESENYGNFYDNQIPFCTRFFISISLPPALQSHIAVCINCFASLAFASEILEWEANFC